jgi:hypothetical protein
MKKVTPPLVVPKPCHAKWADMDGDEKKRFCSECGKHVHNLSAMTVGEAQRFADETKGRECVAYVRTGDKMLAPNFIERLLLRIAGWKPAFAKVLALVLPAALASCVSRPTAGVPNKNVVPPKERKHLGNTEQAVLLGEPATVPVPGSPVPTVGKVRYVPPKK